MPIVRPALPPWGSAARRLRRAPLALPLVLRTSRLHRACLRRRHAGRGPEVARRATAGCAGGEGTDVPSTPGLHCATAAPRSARSAARAPHVAPASRLPATPSCWARSRSRPPGNRRLRRRSRVAHRACNILPCGSPRPSYKAEPGRRPTATAKAAGREGTAVPSIRPPSSPAHPPCGSASRRLRRAALALALRASSTTTFRLTSWSFHHAYRCETRSMIRLK